MVAVHSWDSQPVFRITSLSRLHPSKSLSIVLCWKCSSYPKTKSSRWDISSIVPKAITAHNRQSSVKKGLYRMFVLCVKCDSSLPPKATTTTKNNDSFNENWLEEVGPDPSQLFWPPNMTHTTQHLYSLTNLLALKHAHTQTNVLLVRSFESCCNKYWISPWRKSVLGETTHSCNCWEMETDDLTPGHSTNQMTIFKESNFCY